jgi:hypothetical protein
LALLHPGRHDGGDAALSGRKREKEWWVVSGLRQWKESQVTGDSVGVEGRMEAAVVVVRVKELEDAVTRCWVAVLGPSARVGDPWPQWPP